MDPLSMFCVVGALYLYALSKGEEYERERFRDRVRGEHVNTAARIDALYDKLSQERRARIKNEEDFLKEEAFFSS
jgi:hypothetical protein